MLRALLLPLTRLTRSPLVALALLASAQGAAAQAPQPAPAQPPAATYPAPAQQPAQPYPQQAQPYVQPAQPYAPPPYATPPTPTPYVTPYPQMPGYYQPYRPPRARRGMMIAGISILSGSYLLATAVGGGLMDRSADDDEDGFVDCRNCRRAGPWLFVPLVGPFVAMSKVDEGSWGLWLLGMVELVGAALTTGGIIRYQNTKRAAQAGFAQWTLPKGRSLSLDVAGGTHFRGPRLQLSF